MSISLRTRITAIVIFVIAVVVTVTLVVAYHEMAEAMYYAIDQIVLRDAEVVRSELAEGSIAGIDDAQRLSELTSLLSRPDRLHSPLYRIWIEGAAGDLLSSDLASSEQYRALGDVPLSGRGNQRKHQITTIVAGDKEYRALDMQIRLSESGKVVNAIIAAPCDYAIHEIQEFRYFMLIFGGIVIVVAGAVASLLVHGAMRPVGILAERLQKITHQNLSDSSLDYARIPSDLQPFAKSVSSMLSRLDRAFEQQRQFAADAAHELRSPLAVAKSTVQSTLAMPEYERDYAEMARSELEDLRRMERVIEQLLTLARVEAAPTPHDQIELQSVLAESVDLSGESPQGTCVVLDDKIPKVFILGQREELVRLFCNLINNAVIHGPVGGTVTIGAVILGDCGVRVTVHDEGGSIPPEAISHLTERFYRVDASRTRRTGGTGLGLAIAAEIARLHGGDIEIESSQEKGTLVSVTLTSC